MQCQNWVSFCKISASKIILTKNIKNQTYSLLKWNDAEPTRVGPLCLCFNMFSGFKPTKFAVEVFNENFLKDVKFSFEPVKF